MTRNTLHVYFAPILIGACSAENGPVPCSEDFDCPVGQLCGSGDTCEDAAPGTERNFGRVGLDFQIGNESYLLGVFVVPTDEGTAGDFASFALSAGGVDAGALTLAPQQPRLTLSKEEQAFWRARAAFESARYAGIGRLIDDIRARRRTVGTGYTRQVCAQQCTDPNVCWAGSCVSSVDLQFAAESPAVPITTRALGTVTSGAIRVAVLIESAADPVVDAEARAAALDFASTASQVLAFLGVQGGHAYPLDVDTNQEITLVLTDRLSGLTGVVGFFDYRDFLTPANGGTGNAADLLWSRVPTGEVMADCPAPAGCSQDVITRELVVGTLVHEYTHLVTFAKRVVGPGGSPASNEVQWLDEAVAHLMEDLTGWGPSNVGTPVAAFTAWNTSSFAGPNGDDNVDTPARRGMAYMLLRHIVDQQAASAGNAAQVTAANTSLLKNLLVDNERGFMHPIFQTRGADGLWAWLRATFATNHPDANAMTPEAKADPYLDVADGGPNALPMGFDPYGLFLDARGAEFTFSGPPNDPLDATSFPYTGDVPLSGALLFNVSGLDTGTTELTARGDAHVDLQIRAVRVW